jgi:hypothetical protein
VKVPEQVARLGLVLGVLLAIIIPLRFFILPYSMFHYQPHQAAKVEREKLKPMHYAGALSCTECHADEAKLKLASYHRTVACETCHGPSAEHVKQPNLASANPVSPGERKLCPVCHAYDPTRPNGFPQVDLAKHNPRKACIRCHDPHDPVPSETPQQCSACHGRIARTLAVSTHALIECTRCHEVSEQHKLQPRTALPSKPSTREFCGECHSKDAAASTVPRVDMASHGGAFTCWQCHYAHLPEGHR